MGVVYSHVNLQSTTVGTLSYSEGHLIDMIAYSHCNNLNHNYLLDDYRQIPHTDLIYFLTFNIFNTGLLLTNRVLLQCS